jgi:hypothetical protein
LACAGQPFILSASGADLYTWTPGPQIGGSITITPTVITGYTVTGTSTLTGCSSSVVITPSVISTPSVSTVSTPSISCAGQPVVLSASGADLYTWNPGPQIGGSITITPTVTTGYTVTGTSTLTGCIGSVVVTPSVASTPSVSAASVPSISCAGQSVVLSASGADLYTWNPGSQNGTNIVLTPTVTTNYTVTGTNTLTGCSGSAIITQPVSLCTGLSHQVLSRQSPVKIAPNPNGGEFTISTSWDLDLTIINGLGQIVKTIRSDEINDHKMIISGLQSGIYFINGNGPYQFIREKIIVLD